MSQNANVINLGISNKQLVSTTAVATATVIVTAGCLKVVSGVLIPPVKKLTAKLEKKTEERKNK